MSLTFKVTIGDALPTGEGWTPEVAMRDLGERLRTLPAADYLPALRDAFRLHDRVLAGECEAQKSLAEELYGQLHDIVRDRHALTDEAQVVRLLNAYRRGRT